MKRVYSFQELPKFLNSVAPAGFLVSVTANSISSLIKTTRGKEKLLALAQYISELIKLAMEDYVSMNHISKQPLHLFNSIQIEKSMKNGRKLMRLLMFTDDLAYLEKLYEKKETLHFVTGLMVCVSLSNIVYYILDNLVWLSDIGIISKFVSHANIRWKDTKDISSLVRCTCGVLISFITSFRTIDKIQKLKTEFLEHPEKVIKKHKGVHLKVIELIDTRREHLFKVLDVILNILRFVMLAHALNFPLLKKCSKIFISVCGIVSTSLAIFNTLIGDPRN